jgi:hypothetical protein
MEMAPKVAELMAEELEQDDSWRETQVEAYRKTALGYLPETGSTA